MSTDSSAATKSASENKSAPRLAAKLRGLSAMVTLTLLTFLLLNAAAHVVFLNLRQKREGVSVGKYFVSPLSPEGMALLRQIRPAADDALLRTLATGDPGIRPHTVLHFTEGLARPYYSVGVEGVRRESGWSDREVRQWLLEAGRHTYLFGGSTAFGHGVTDDETLAAALNRSRGDGLTFNFGVEAYDSRREVDKLLHLLRKGYRPGRVVFLDGLNDVTTFAWSPYEAFDKPRTQGMILDRGEVPLVFGFPRRNNMWAALSFSFPAVQLARRLATPAPPADYRLKSADEAPIDWGELMLFYERWDRIQVGRAEALAEELVEYYGRNIAFVQQLGLAFGFESRFVYQPIGLLESVQPFLKPEFDESDSKKIYQTVDERIRREIQAGGLAMVDCSQALSGLENAYIDASHYSPQGNQRLAECVADGWRESPPK